MRLLLGGAEGPSALLLEDLREQVRDRTVELEESRVECLAILAAVGEFSYEDSRGHNHRVGLTAAAIAKALDLPDAFVDDIRDAAPLHDIGKVGVPRRILLKRGALTEAERIGMMRHVEIGAHILSAGRSRLLRMASEIARTHHERWDGSGYMEGLAGEEIPLGGRITAVADVFDALTHDRPYERAWPVDRAFSDIVAQAARQFDPRVVHAFTTIDLEAAVSEPAGAYAGRLVLN